jgi:hypothetical protein
VSSAQSQKTTDVARLERLAVEANTPSRHADVARQFRLRAEELNAKAVRHEAEVKRLRAARMPHEHKIPEAVQQPLAREREQALQARRAAREAAQMAQRHTNLSVELLASR